MSWKGVNRLAMKGSKSRQSKRVGKRCSKTKGEGEEQKARKRRSRKGNECERVKGT